MLMTRRLHEPEAPERSLHCRSRQQFPHRVPGRMASGGPATRIQSWCSSAANLLVGSFFPLRENRVPPADLEWPWPADANVSRPDVRVWVMNFVGHLFSKKL